MNEREIFNTARHIAVGDERDAYLHDACAGDADLRVRVEELLLADGAAGSFLQTPVLDGPDTVLIKGNSRSSNTERTQLHVEEDALDFLSPADSPAALGRFGPYEITERIGRGGMGIVLKGHDAKLNRVVALKIMAPELAGNATARRRFKREAQAAAAVAHPHIVTIYAVDEDRLPFLVMEFVDGMSLQEKIDREGHLELKEILRIGTQIASGLAAAHAHGVIHRDIKPANILLENGVERVRITDFGLARAADDVAMTNTGDVAGTPQYMSPEQAQGQTVDSRTDLFSFGSVLYAMCAGRSPFRADTTMGALRRVCDDRQRPIREVNPDVPVWLVDIIDRLLEKDPARRYQTAGEVAELLGKHLAHVQDPESAPFPGKPDSRGAPARSGRRQRWLVAAGILFALATCFAATEATGVTRLSGTVIRIVTGEGTLVIEVDDPTVQVALDGEELSITGAGLKELRLRPGQYRFEATRDGERVMSEIVTIIRDDREVVRVTREPPRAEAPVSESAPRGQFVVLSGDNADAVAFDTLGEAVRASAHGETIEIRGDGPFVADPIVVKHALTIRAGENCRPVLRQSQESVDTKCLIVTYGALVLEGLVLESITRVSDATQWSGNVAQIGSGSLHATNCRFVRQAKGACVCVQGNGVNVLRNCEFVASPTHWSIQYWSASSTSPYLVENCCLTASISVAYLGAGQGTAIHLRRNTVLGTPSVYVNVLALTPDDQGQAPSPSIRLEASNNILSPGARWPVFLANFKSGLQERADEASLLLPGLVSWRGDHNLFPADMQMLQVSLGFDLQRAESLTGLAAWSDFWGQTESNSQQGLIRLHGGDLLETSTSSLDRIAPEDFRLWSDGDDDPSGLHGVDPGADVTVVGPGVAYERWKRVPEYSKWLAATAQHLADAPPLAIAPFDSSQAQAHQKTWAAHLEVPLELTNSIGMTFRLMPPGEFTMGSGADEQRSALSTIESTLRQFLSQDQGDVVYVERLRPLVASEGPAHRVVISRPWYLGATEVTAAQFEQFVTASGYVTDAERSMDGGIVWGRHGPDSSREFNWRTPGRLPRGPDHPVTQVSYDDARAFCRWLSDREGIPYDLPTEAQWEYACRAGTETPWSFGDDPAAIVDFAWSETDNEPLRHEFELHGVGLKQPNAFGLFDMHGNAQEWCRDWYSRSSYTAGGDVDPTATTGPDDEQTRVLRGGAIYLPGDLRSAMRRCGAVSFTENTVGFRVAIVGELSGPDLSRSVNGRTESPELPASNEWVWTPPVNLGEPVNSELGDSYPFVAADGLTLMFSSYRPGGQGQIDLWQCRRLSIDDPWNAPVNLGEGINTSKMETYPFLSADGLTLFVSSDRPGGAGHWDIWTYQRETQTAQWSAAINVGAPINSPRGDAAPFLTPDGLVILFQSDRPGGQGAGDLWISRRSSLTAEWMEPVPLGPSVNTEYEEWDPCLTSDGRTLFFASDRPGGAGSMDIWMSRGASPFGPWTLPINLGLLNTSGNDASPSLSGGDDRLYFESGRSGNMGAHDLWMSTRVPMIDYVARANQRAGQGRLDEAAEDFALALSLTDTQEPGNAERARIVKQIVESDELFRRVVDLQPQTVGLWSRRGTFLEDAGRWDEASACFRKRLELGPDGAGLWYHAAVALFAVGDLDGYRNRCEEMLSNFGDVSDAQEAWFAAWPMAIAPDSVIDKQRALRLAERAMNGLPDIFYGARASAAWLYRLDRLEESISVWETAGQRDSEEIRDCFLAMAHHRLGNTVEALEYAGHARLNAAEWSKSMPGDRRVIFERLLGEMDAVLAGPPDSDQIPSPAANHTCRGG